MSHQTRQTYKALGKAYLTRIKDIKASGFEEFVRVIKPGGKVLDVGCAGGRDTKRLTDLGFVVTGIDFVEEFLREAKKLVPAAKFIKMDVKKIDFDETFDAIWANAVLLHLKKTEIESVLTSLYRILKPGGYLFLGLRKGEGEAWSADRLSEQHRRFFAYYQEDEIKKVLKKLKYKIIFIKDEADRAGRDNLRWLVVLAQK